MVKKKGKTKNRPEKSRQINPYVNINWEKAAVLFQKHTIFQSTENKLPRVKDILSILAGVGGVGLMFAFPGAGAGIATLMLGNTSYSRWKGKKVFGQLVKQKYVEITYNGNGSITARITKRGLQRVLTYKLGEMKLRTEKKWDRKWRVVLFDIPEKYKRVRDEFRNRLIHLGLYLYQKSAYLSPYPCFDEVEFLRQLYGISFEVKYLLVEKIEDDKDLRTYFNLI